MWAFFPLTPPAAVAAGGVVGRWLVGREAASSRWAPAVASCIVAAVAMLVWVKFILPHQPRVPGRGPLGLGPIAHIPASKGPILDFLQQHIGLKPGSEFRGYAVTFLGAPDGLVRKLTNTPNERMTYDAYVDARAMLSDRIISIETCWPSRRTKSIHCRRAFFFTVSILSFFAPSAFVSSSRTAPSRIRRSNGL
jgi:hypothetical protein